MGPLWDLDNTLGNIRFDKYFFDDTSFLWAQNGVFQNYVRTFAKNLMEHTGCDAIMVGRGAQGNPWIFKRILHYLETGEELPPLSFEWKMEVLRQQVIDSVNLLDERRGILHVRRHLANSPMFKGIPNFKETRIAMLRTETVKDLFSILDYIKGNYAI